MPEQSPYRSFDIDEIFGSVMSEFDKISSERIRALSFVRVRDARTGCLSVTTYSFAGFMASVSVTITSFDGAGSRTRLP